MLQESYHIKIADFEGPFDLLLFFIQRDELDINNIPIHKITNDFLDYIHEMEKLNIELASEFILFAAILMRIKARSLLPRKQVDENGEEIDFQKELQDRLIEYKKIKETSSFFTELESKKMQLLSRGNIALETSVLSSMIQDSSEMESITSFKILKAFERVLSKYIDKKNEIVHTVFTYNFNMKESRNYIMEITSSKQKKSFETIFSVCNNRLHAIFLFLSILELVQEKYIKIIIGENINDFYIDKLENNVLN